jgi:hypothetical protein
MPKITMRKVSRKRLCFEPYKTRLVRALTPADKAKWREFCKEMQLRMDENGFVERLIFPDEGTFRMYDKVNRHYDRIWGTEQPHAQTEHQHDSAKVNIFCVLSRKNAQPIFLH